MTDRTIAFILVPAMIAGLVSCARPSGLRTDYREDPLGIEGKPSLSWLQTGTFQSAYRIQAFAEDSLVWDSGRIQDSNSVQIPVGFEIHPEQKYKWRVKTWNGHGRAGRWSAKASFETGIAGWDGARWIGSDKCLVSKYRANEVISYTLALSPDSEAASFVFGARTDSDYAGVELSADGEVRIYHVIGGVRCDDGCEDVSHILNGTVYDPQAFELDIFASQYCRCYNVGIKLNGKPVINTHKEIKEEIDPLKKIMVAGPKGEFIVDFGLGDTFVNSRLYAVGCAGMGSLSDIVIKDRAWKEPIYEDREVHTIDGMDTWLPGASVSAPILRKKFTADGKARRARLYASARGIYECSINGHKVSESYYNPGWSEYGKHLFYNVFDVTSLVCKDENVLEVVLGQGWWSGFLGYQASWEDQYGVRQSFLGKLVIEYADGTCETIVSDASWMKADDGPVLENSFQNGEEYDARRKVLKWEPVTLFDAPETILTAYLGELIHVARTVEAVSMTEPRPGVYIYDMGVNMVGIPSVDLCVREGQRVTFRYGEMLWPENVPSNPVAPYTIEDYITHRGTLYTDNYRSAISTDVFIGDGDSHTFEPGLTQHGYRYVQIEGLDAPLGLSSVRGLVLHGMDGDRTSSFETSDTLVNQLFENIVRGQEGNFLAVPTDCPQRDERLGYTGDGQVFAMSATYNYNVDPFLKRWLLSVRDDQHPNGNYADFSPNLGEPSSPFRGEGNIGWADAGILVPWYLYLQYADKSILEQSFDGMSRYMDYLESKAVDGIMPFPGLGDWLAPERTSQQIVHTCYLAIDARIMADASRVLGRDPSHYDTLYAKVKESFNRTFVSSKGRTYIPKGLQKGIWIITRTLEEDEPEDTQASYVMPLLAGLFDNPQAAADRLAEKIRENGNKLSTGFLATPSICKVLTEYGHSDVAYDLLLQKECPSWLYPVTQGATTMWERWNSFTHDRGFGPVDMNSFNHYSYGAVEEWLVQDVLGIKAAEPGYKVFRLNPHPSERLDFARGHFDTVHGRIEAGWERRPGGGFYYTFTVPPGTRALCKGKCFTKGKYRIEL